ncbi:MAG: TrkH family potassium uptake protein [Halobacteria archaeon]
MTFETNVNWKAACSYTGLVIKYLSITFSVPVITAVFYGESVEPFLAAAFISLILGYGMEKLGDGSDIWVREGFLMVSLTWLLVAVVGAVPYVVAGSGSLASPVNALFESMSGFTTTGSTVMADISLSKHTHSIMLWRQLTQWLGGMGIVVLAVAVLPKLNTSEGSQLVGDEAPGPTTEKLTPHIADTAKILWKLYVAITLAEIGLLYLLHLAGFAPAMNLYNAVSHGFTTLSTGGFSPQARSIQAFTSIAQWVVIPFMFVAGVNFSLMWQAVTERSPKKVVKNSEFKTYTAIILTFSLVLVALGSGGGFSSGLGSAGVVKDSVFQTVSLITTTGFANVDFTHWSPTPKLVLFFVIFIGGSAGSTAGAIKVVRWLVIYKAIKRRLFSSIHQDAVKPIKVGDRIMDESTIQGIHLFTLLYFLIFAVSTLVVVGTSRFAGFEIDTYAGMTAVSATLGNVGPGLGAVGPMDNFLKFPDLPKMLMFFLMWMGRLEIISVLVILTPSYWRS